MFCTPESLQFPRFALFRKRTDATPVSAFRPYKRVSNLLDLI